MKRRTTALLGTFTALVLAGPLAAQSTASNPRSRTPPPKPRTAEIPRSPQAPAQPQPVPDPNTTGLYTNFTPPPPPNTTGIINNYGPQPIAQVSYYPTTVLANGHVMANFGTGRGYEEVLRRCPQITGTLPPGFAIAPCYTVDANGRYSVLMQH